ncbi:MAG: rhodanese-like domain-containing protein [Desulfobaccales bacterium]
MRLVTAPQLHHIIKSTVEYALLDVRERGLFSKEHVLLSSCMPLSQLEMMVSDLVPRFSTKIIVISEGPTDRDDLSERAAKRLQELGFTDVAILQDGIAGWRSAGFKLFSGVHVLSKAFGEIVADIYKTPFLSPQQEHQKIQGHDKHIILDCRPEDEYNRMTIPGSVNVPGAELVYRVHDIVPDAKTLVVVHCAGRTRSIIGAQSLINAGIPNPVVALEDGTMGWQLAGFELEYGQTRCAPPPSAQGLARAKDCAARVAKRFGLRKIPFAALNRWMTDTEERTTYVIDVRLPKEFEAGHLHGSRNIQGGQLIQGTNEYIAVHNARVVLLDDTEVRATMIASWLIQMGWSDVYVLEGGIGNMPLFSGPSPARVLGFERGVALEPRELHKLSSSFEDPAVVLDLACSTFFKARHIPLAWWGIRSRLPEDLSKLPHTNPCILTSEDGILAHLAAADLRRLKPEAKVFVLEGGTKAWIKAGLPTSQGMENAISGVDDIWYMPYLFPDAPEQAKRDYLEWEVALVEQVERDGTAKFRKFCEQS